MDEDVQTRGALAFFRRGFRQKGLSLKKGLSLEREATPLAGRALARSVLAGALLLVLLLAGAPATHAQVADADDYEEQTAAEQMQAAAVGDSVQLILLNRQLRPAGVIVQQNEASLELRKLNGQREVFNRRFIYAVAPLGEGALPRRPRQQEEEVVAEAPEEEEPEPEEEATPGEEEEETAAPPPDPAGASAAPGAEEEPIPDVNRTRLLLAPTARTQQARQVYLASHEILFPYVSVGLGNVLDVRGGISVTPNTVQFMYGGAKIGLIQSGRFNLAVGGIGMATTNVITVEGGQDEYGGVAYALATFGTPDAALTVGTGYLAAGGSVEEKALALVGGEWRLGESNVKLLTENYLLFGSGAEENSKALFGGELFGGGVSGIVSAGVRLVGARTSIDLGVATSNRWWDAVLPAVPIVTFSYDLGTF